MFLLTLKHLQNKRFLLRSAFLFDALTLSASARILSRKLLQTTLVLNLIERRPPTRILIRKPLATFSHFLCSDMDGDKSVALVLRWHACTILDRSRLKKALAKALAFDASAIWTRMAIS
jgi:hypothetical protein